MRCDGPSRMEESCSFEVDEAEDCPVRLLDEPGQAVFGVGSLFVAFAARGPDVDGSLLHALPFPDLEEIFIKSFAEIRRERNAREVSRA